MWCLVVFQHDLHGWYLLQGKEKGSCLRPRPLARNRTKKYYGVITKRMNFNCPNVENSESIEPNDNDLELNASAYTCDKQT